MLTPGIVLDTGKRVFTQQFVKLAEIPDVKYYLDKKTNSTLFGKTSTSNTAVFDVEHILEVIDTLSNINYSFKFTLPNSTSGQF